MLKLLSVNIEGKKHLNKIVDLIERVQPDVICMQEVFEDTIEELNANFGGEVFFSPIVLKTKDGIDKTEEELARGPFETVRFGTMILSRLPVSNATEDYYFGDREVLRMHRSGFYTDIALVLSSVDAEKDGVLFRIATTHLCKSETGEVVSEFQRDSTHKLLDAMGKLGELIACGDFNAPRGKEIFSLINEKYTDNISPEYTTSLDPDLHRAGPLPYMVDGLFTTPAYKVTHMHFETGVSDHYAIVAEIERD
jgi:endonuclease/exonuclease/phosphatase family metal-dependent hydrolase